MIAACLSIPANYDLIEDWTDPEGRKIQLAGHSKAGVGVKTQCYNAPILDRMQKQGYAALANFCIDVMPPIAMFGLSLS